MFSSEILTQVEEGPHCLNPFPRPRPHKTSVFLLPQLPHLLRTLCNKYNSITLSTWNHHDPPNSRWETEVQGGDQLLHNSLTEVAGSVGVEWLLTPRPNGGQTLMGPGHSMRP